MQEERDRRAGIDSRVYTAIYKKSNNKRLMGEGIEGGKVNVYDCGLAIMACSQSTQFRPAPISTLSYIPAFRVWVDAYTCGCSRPRSQPSWQQQRRDYSLSQFFYL